MWTTITITVSILILGQCLAVSPIRKELKVPGAVKCGNDVCSFPYELCVVRARCNPKPKQPCDLCILTSSIPKPPYGSPGAKDLKNILKTKVASAAAAVSDAVNTNTQGASVNQAPAQDPFNWLDIFNFGGSPTPPTTGTANDFMNSDLMHMWMLNDRQLF